MIVHVRNFGIIESADVNIGNFSIFVGENNSGKTCLIQLIYGLISHLANVNVTNFLDAMESFSIDSINAGTFCIDCDDTAFYTSLQDKLNSFLDKNKNKIVKNIFHTDKLNVESLSVEFEKPSFNYFVNCKNDAYVISSDDIEKQPDKCYTISKNNDIVSTISFLHDFPKDKTNNILKQKLLSIILADLIGCSRIGETEPAIYLPASRAGLMMLYEHYLSHTMKTKHDMRINDTIVYENEEKPVENEYGLTQPVYDFLIFLLKHKNSENLIQHGKNKILDFINENIINGRLEKFGTAIRYTPDAADDSLPLPLSPSLVSEITPIYMVLSGINNIEYILYDGINTCQHPNTQLQTARMLIRMINAGYKMIVSTHSDTMVVAINNLLKLSHVKGRKKLAVKLGYTEDDLLKNADVHAYQFNVDETTGKTKVEEISDYLSLGIGFDFDTFDKANEKLYSDAIALSEADNC